jgi:hypothetical protein
MSLNATDKRTVLKRIALARSRVMVEISGNRNGGDKFAAGLASEGWAGGYLQALDDVDAALRHGFPSDPRGYWKGKP